ncbi:MAG: aldehyde dehydrogenase family protein [Sneathiella sp.]|nr:aldehyde dehydrogenase family protein [Sneathiella sp.]
MTLKALISEAMSSGSLEGLPNKHFIHGEFVSSADGRLLDSVDPGTGRIHTNFARGDAQDVDRAVKSASLAFPVWRNIKPADRGRILLNMSQLLSAHKDRLAVVETLDSGKPIQEAIGDINGAIRTFEFYAGACDKIHGDVFPLPTEYLSYSLLEPVGIAAQIIPWNFPISTTARGIAPALAAGCCVVAKPAEQTPITALMMAELLSAAGLPDGVFNVVTGLGKEAGSALVSHPEINHVTFTGSVPTGIGVMKAAADNITRVVLELGGKSPIVIFKDADLDQAANGVMEAIFENAGQICSAGSRLLIDKSVQYEFLSILTARIRKMQLGHGLTSPDMGPVNSQAQLDKIEAYLWNAKSRGLEVLIGGNRADTEQGYFFEPTILNNVPADDVTVLEEIFGPILVTQPFDTLEEAISLSNGTDFALVAGLYTKDLSTALQFANKVDAGQVFVNEYFTGGVEVPFGGNKKSGFGREKGMEALKTYSKQKSVTIRL